MEQVSTSRGASGSREIASNSRLKAGFASNWQLGPEFDVKPVENPNGVPSAPQISSDAAAVSESFSDSVYNGPWETELIEGQSINLPSDLLSLENIYSLFSIDVWRSLSPEDRESLKQYLPSKPSENREVQKPSDHDIEIDIDSSQPMETSVKKPLLSDEEADNIVEGLLTGKIKNLGLNQAERFARELADGLFNAEVVKYKEKLEEQRKMKRLLHLKRHNMTMLRKILETSQRLGRDVEPDLREMERLQTLFKEEDKKRLRIVAAEEQRAEENDFLRPLPRPARRAGPGKGGRSSSTDRASGMIPRDLSAYADEDLDPLVSRELRSTSAAPEASISSYSVSESAFAPQSDAGDEISTSETTKKRKRDTELLEPKMDELEPFKAQSSDQSTADEQAPKAKRARTTSSRKDQKAANAAISLPIDSFSLFKTIYQCLATQAPNPVPLQTIVAAVENEARIVQLLTGALTVESLTKLALIYLSSPFSPLQTENCPKIAAKSSDTDWTFVPQQPDVPDVPSVIQPRLDRFESVFWFTVTRGHYDLSKGDIFSTAVNKLLTGRAPATISEIHTHTDRLSFQQQEPHRYAGADKPFEYVFKNPDGSVKQRAVVAPCKVQRGRESGHLKADRPPAVTMLSIVRDAIARLPGGVGIRSDIPILLKDSLYLQEPPSDAEQAKFNQFISSALDRIQAEVDSPLRFDSELKLWIYQHRQRTINDFDNYFTKLKSLESASGASGDSAKSAAE